MDIATNMAWDTAAHTAWTMHLRLHGLLCLHLPDGSTAILMRATLWGNYCVGCKIWEFHPLEGCTVLYLWEVSCGLHLQGSGMQVFFGHCEVQWFQKSSGLQSLDYYGMHLGNFTSKNGRFCKTENILIYGQKSVDFEAIWALGFCDLSGATV